MSGEAKAHRAAHARRVRARLVVATLLAALAATWEPRTWGPFEVAGLDLGPPFGWGVQIIAVVGIFLALAAAANAWLLSRAASGEARDDGRASAAPVPARWTIGAADVVLFAVALAVTGFAWWRAIDRDAWRTGAWTMAWHGPNGEALPSRLDDLHADWTGCETFDVGFEWLVFDGAVWSVCEPHPAFPGGALGRITPADRRGDVRWIFPPRLAHRATRGLLPQGRELAIVYETAEGDLAWAVAGPEGWIAAPSAIARARGGDLRGLAWLDGAIVAITAGRDGPRLHRWGGAVEDLAPPCPEGASCRTLAAWRHREQWCWLLESTPMTPLTACGDEPPTRLGSGRAHLSADRVVVPAAGTLSTFGPGWVIHPGGRLERIAPPPDLSDASLLNGLLGGEGELVWRPAWRHRTEDGGAVHRPGAPVVEDAESMTALIADGRRHVVARTGVLCQMHDAALLPRSDGGYFLVHPRGCLVAVTADLARADPLSLEEHLARRGSRGLGWNERRHLWMLRFVKLGLLPVLLATALFARRRDDGWPLLRRPIGLAAAFYLGLALVALRAVIPLLG